MRPVFDADPMTNYTLCLLYIVIGIRNKCVESLIEWIEEGVKKFIPEKIPARYTVVYAEAQLEIAVESNDDWHRNNGIVLVDKM